MKINEAELKLMKESLGIVTDLRQGARKNQPYFAL
jgi:hypothetical protein